MAPRGSFGKYLKSAFLWHWNLLALGAGVILAFLSGLPDVVLPLVAAGEVAYLGLLSTNPRFRKAVDAQVYSDKAEIMRGEQLKQILAALPPRDIKRFELLKQRCLVLQQLGKQFRGLDSKDMAGFSDMHLASMERLLWMFLKLLYSKDALDTFLRHTQRENLVREISETEARLEKARQKGRESLIRSLEDKLSTVKERLRNYDAAEDNAELINVELERIEQKVNAVSELSLQSADPAMLSAQVDGIAESLSVTADAIKSLDGVPDLEYDDEVPVFLREEV